MYGPSFRGRLSNLKKSRDFWTLLSLQLSRPVSTQLSSNAGMSVRSTVITACIDRTAKKCPGGGLVMVEIGCGAFVTSKTIAILAC